jgi:hypothetical protein
LAQSVQRSAFPGRYGERLAEAGRILTRLEGKTGAVGSAGKVPGGGGLNPQDLKGLIPKSQLVQRLVNPPPPIRDLPSQSVQPRKPMAGPVLAGQKGAGVSQLQETGRGVPTAYQSRTETVREQIPGSIRQALLQKLMAEQGAKQPRPDKAAGVGAPTGPGGFPGRVRIASGADRAGVSTSGAVKQFVREISSLYGRPLTIGTGTNHSRMTTSGNVSDHWSGHAADIPASGRELVRLGRLALIAAGANRKWAKRQTGGVYNINGHQILFRTMVGGNHFNHLHVSAY